MVEFALIAAFFLVFLITAAQALQMVYSALTLQFLASRSMRTMVVGPQTAGTSSTQQAALLQENLIAAGRAYNLQLDGSQIHICPVSSTAPDIDCAADDAGESGAMMTIHIVHPFRFFFGLGTFNLEALALGKNEPY